MLTFSKRIWFHFFLCLWKRPSPPISAWCCFVLEILSFKLETLIMEMWGWRYLIYDVRLKGLFQVSDAYQRRDLKRTTCPPCSICFPLLDVASNCNSINNQHVECTDCLVFKWHTAHCLHITLFQSLREACGESAVLISILQMRVLTRS